MNLNQHAKNQAILLFCSIDNLVDLKILVSDWQRAFGQYLRNLIFSKYGICAGMYKIILNLYKTFI